MSSSPPYSLAPASSSMCLLQQPAASPAALDLTSVNESSVSRAPLASSFSGHLILLAPTRSGHSDSGEAGGSSSALSLSSQNEVVDERSASRTSELAGTLPTIPILPAQSSVGLAPSSLPWRLSRIDVDALLRTQGEDDISWCSAFGTSHPCVFADEANGSVPVVVKVLAKQQFTDSEQITLATALATAAACTDTSRRLAGPLAICLDPPRVAMVFPRYPAGSLADLLANETPILHPRHPQTLHVIARGLLTSMTRLSTALANFPDACKAHGALSPSNVMLVATAGYVVDTHIIDFGLSDLVDIFGIHRTIPSVGYMSPEQLRGETPTAASDVFIIGSILFELLVGSSPFMGSDPLEIATRISAGVTSSLATSRIPSERLRTLISSCWAVEPADRPTMADVATIVASLGSADFATLNDSGAITASYARIVM
ncbi:uncharacterized protein AMSG_11584 [Thecamonas trahens ATCC 50062]|uniref:Protein kinase domain-containing protein n=1 Tax=Thecamonas trahens ATCC 50062 TaxID=461836 RepID=A0A0L0D0I2_THETB|nr:hypothetical protein AMSG_11584 [Thecamonas trahens ATCC 50062]KNC45889.1 hypothetical protein AMSG_11584 [Thecamonas trahens ATCC 50062]|eukprot:XP_013763182.1 hypothetical protein AMSG_11584 [Thecamonas trahens ATCC 50062]